MRGKERRGEERRIVELEQGESVDPDRIKEKEKNKRERKKERKKGKVKRVVGPHTRPSADRVYALDQACEDEMIKGEKMDEEKNKQG